MLTKTVKDARSFLNGIGEMYESIKSECNIKIASMGLKFNDDVFSDTIVKCYDTISHENHDCIDIAAYFWSSFKQNTVNERKKWINNTVDTIPDIPNRDEGYERFENEDTLSLVLDQLVETFGKDVVDLYIRHVNGLTYKELLEISDIKNLSYQFRKIKRVLRAMKSCVFT